MENAELTALVDLNLAASNLRVIADNLVMDPEGIRVAEALLFIALAQIADMLVAARTSGDLNAPKGL
jgi:hypothetical protein